MAATPPPSPPPSIEQLLEPLIRRVENIELSINKTIAESIAGAIRASDELVATMQKQLEATHLKYDDLLGKQGDRIRTLKRALIRLHGSQDDLEMKSRRWNVRIENITYDKAESDAQLK